MYKIKMLLPLLFACGPKVSFQNYSLPSESPCLDGTIINIDSEGCKTFFWGVRKDTIKLRCTMTRDQSWWVNTSFYFVPNTSEDRPDNHWQSFCKDETYRVYKGTTLLRMGDITSAEKSSLDFRGGDYHIKNGIILER
jgi:hypothetical protein